MIPPHFLGIGAQKAGTTWLYHVLRAHPDIWLPPVKELHYFDQNLKVPKTFRQRLIGRQSDNRRWRRHLELQSQRVVSALVFLGSGGRVFWGRGQRELDNDWWRAYLTQLRRYPAQFAADLVWSFNYFCRRPTDAWYTRLFEPGRGKVTGDITPAYAVLSETHVARVRAMLPHAKIIFIMRNPIERTWSAARMLWRNGTYDIDNEAHLMGYARLEPVVLRSNYFRTLAIWERYYPKTQIFLAFTEELRDSPEDLLLKIYRFLGVEASTRHIPSYAKRQVNTGASREIPKCFARELARQYYSQLKALNARFGGSYTTEWLRSAEMILNSEDRP
ncbi:MAG: sulfotransferase [Candidatus Omnitrophica bacterium]|nr:sulfotransferase [Candidatus Omnitrophota bacterium]